MVAWGMRRALLADCHLGQAQGDGPRFAAALQQLLADGVGELVLGGDVFRTLVGFPRFWNREILAGLEQLAALRQRGVRVVWVEGNRDFFLDSPAMDRFRDRFVRSYGFAAGGRRFLVEHGDLVNTEDRRYLLWRALSKSRLARAFAQLLPKTVALGIVGSTERALLQTNFSYRRALPEQQLQKRARAHFAAGVDVVFWGHFHKRWRFVEGSREAHVLPPWLETGCVVYIEGDGTILWPEEADQLVDKGEGFCYQAQEMAR